MGGSEGGWEALDEFICGETKHGFAPPGVCRASQGVAFVDDEHVPSLRVVFFITAQESID